jgi:hypothetical protein
VGDAAGGGLALVIKAAAWAHLGGGGRGGSRHCQVLGARCGGGKGKRSLDGFNRGNLTQPDGKTFWWSFYTSLEFLDCFQGFYKNFSIGL